MSTFTCLNDLVLYTLLYLKPKKIFSNIFWKIISVGGGAQIPQNTSQNQKLVKRGFSSKKIITV